MVRDKFLILLEYYYRLKHHPFGQFVQLMARALLVVKQVSKERQIGAMAQSLAYTTILSFVPIFAIFFSVLGQITANVMVKENIKGFISIYFIPEYVQNIFEMIEKLSQASLAFGAIGLPTLFLAGVFLYTNVDSSINAIWASTKEKRWVKTSLAFFMTLFFGPTLLVMLFSIPPYLQTLPYYKEIINYPIINTLVTLLAPVLITTAGLFVLYLYMPAIRVHREAAIRGAFSAAILLQISTMVVSSYIKMFANYDLIYGSMAVVPMFLLWVFAIWWGVLVGAVVAFVYQFHKETGYLNVYETYNDESLLCSALSVQVLICQSFEKRNTAPDFEQLQLLLGINRNRLRYLLKILQDNHLVTAFEGISTKKRNCVKYQPATISSGIYLKDLIPLFYHPRKREVFSEKLGELLHLLEIHPGFLNTDMTIYDILKHNEDILTKLENKSLYKPLQAQVASLDN